MENVHFRHRSVPIGSQTDPANRILSLVLTHGLIPLSLFEPRGPISIQAPYRRPIGSDRREGLSFHGRNPRWKSRNSRCFRPAVFRFHFGPSCGCSTDTYCALCLENGPSGSLGLSLHRRFGLQVALKVTPYAEQRFRFAVLSAAPPRKISPSGVSPIRPKTPS